MFVIRRKNTNNKKFSTSSLQHLLLRTLILGPFVICFAIISVHIVSAAIALSTSIAYTQSFDGMGIPATATTVSTLPADFRVDNSSPVRTVGTFGAALSTTARAGGANLSTSASNGIYNFGSGTTSLGGSDRAVGFLSSGTATFSGNLYAQLVNNTGGNLAGLQISYDVEKYRNGSNPNGFRIQLFYSNDGNSWTSAGSDFLTTFAADANNNGFATAPGATVPISNKTLNVTIADGANFYLAWNYSVAATSTTTNAQALAIDNVSILGITGGGSTDPSGVGNANPSVVAAGSSTLLTVTVTPGSNPTSTNLMVSADLTAIGGSNNQSFQDTGADGDEDAGDNIFSYLATVSNATSGGGKILPFTVSDGEARSTGGNINLTVQAPVDHVVISQVYGGGGNTGAPFTNDYVELYNPTANTVSLTGWSVQYASATNTTTWSGRQPIGGTIGPGEYFLISLSGGAVGSPLPLANISGDINMSATTGKVALVSNSQFLFGCPFGSDPDLVDLVGYGTTANCREGTTNSNNAPSASNTTAIFRKSGGAIDTNLNSADWETAAPNPRRTAPIVELGPWVAGTNPFEGNSIAPYDATVTIDFSEPVDVTGAWYNINCAVSGLHNDATVAMYNGFKGYHITPNISFQFGELCTVTVFKDFVSDQDTDDSGADTDHLFADHVFSFTVTLAGDAAPYEPSVHLALGNPSNAIADLLQPNNYLMEKPSFSLSYNRDKGTPNWVSWHLEPDWTGTLPRDDTFRADPKVSPDWYRVQSTDYFSSGFDRGHMTPNADRDHLNRRPINQETFLMTNIVPQSPDNNQGPWAEMENDLRAMLMEPGVTYEMYIVSGPLGVGGEGSSGPADTIANGNVTVPAFTWKVVLMLVKDEDDLTRISPATRTIAVMMPNIQGIRDDDWEDYLTTVDAVEAATGYDFFANVPDAIENSIEAGTNGNNPPGTEDQSTTTAEDTPAPITLSAVSPLVSPTFTFTIVSGPAHGTLSGTGANRTYEPNADFNGSDSFTFRANDGSQDSNVSTVHITITAVNDAPVATNDAYSTDSNTTLNVSVPGVLENDNDVDSLSLTVEVVTSTANGTLTLNPDGSFSYDPATDFTGPDSFTYRVFDGVAYSNNATVTITVNDTVAPILTSTIAMSSLSVTNSNLVNVGLTATATDNGGQPVTIQVAVYGDEDDQTPTIDTTVHSPDAKDIAPATLRLRGERVEANDGRVYLIIVTATDNVGNFSRAYHTVVVPKNNKPANIEAVHAEAEVVKAYAEANGAAPPTFFVVGDGPIIGPKQ